MEWTEARERIRRSIRVGSDVNSPRSRIGKSNVIRIPWQMLEKCFSAVEAGRGYDGRFFREQFPNQTKDHPCHVHVVGQILARSGIAVLMGNVYVRAY